MANPTGIANEEYVPAEYSLSQNYPNPFNPATNIKFSVPKDGNVTLKIYDVKGKEKAVYMKGFLKAGTYNAQINAAGWTSGIYFYKLTADDFSATRKMVLIK